MMRLDHNRAISQVAQKVRRPVSAIRKITVWGNHSATQYPDLFQAEVAEAGAARKAWPLINDQTWLEQTFIPTVQSAARRSSMRAGFPRPRAPPTPQSTTCATGLGGTRDGDWVTMGVPSDGSYGIAEGVIYGYPVTTKGGEYQVVKGIEIERLQQKAHGRHAEGAPRRARRREAPARQMTPHNQGQTTFSPSRESGKRGLSLFFLGPT